VSLVKALTQTSAAERLVAIAILVLWALIYLPNLRTNPNWYGDEGIVLEEAWTLAQGEPRYGAMRLNFLVPNPHPPIYLTVLGFSMKIFGNDILVGRALQALTGLATGIVAFWVGMRLRGRTFGVVCAVAVLTYPEAAVHFRWTRGHPMQGLFALACLGFLICYIQTRRARDVVLAGLMCTLSVGMHFCACPLFGIVFVTALFVDRRHIFLAVAASLVFPIGFLLWLAVSQPGGIGGVISQLTSASAIGFQAVQPSIEQEAWRLYRRVAEFVFLTPTVNQRGIVGTDLWILAGCAGLAFFPERRYRKWLIFWALAMMLGVFAARDTVGMFLYQAFGFVPLLAIGFAGILCVAGDWLAARVPILPQFMRWVPAIIALSALGMVSIVGSFGHFQTKIDRWTVQSSGDAEKVMDFVNHSTGPDDFVVMPDQLFWLYRHERKAQLIQSAVFDFGIAENLAQGVPKSVYWFDPGIENARYAVVAAAAGADGQSRGIDAIFWSGYEGARKVLEKFQSDKWPVVFASGDYLVLENPRFVKTPSVPPGQATP